MVHFLDCSVYVLSDPMVSDHSVGYVVEKRLDGGYMKWNSNNGYVGGHDKATTQRQPVDLNIHEETAIEAPTSNLDVIAEGDSDEESENEELAFVAVGSSLGKFVNDSDVPQAFSHVTYCHTKRKQVVCDLQGVLNKSVRFVSAS